MDFAIKESIQDHFSGLYTLFEENKSIISILHQAVLEGSGLMVPSNYDYEDEQDNSEEEPKHVTEIQRLKKEMEIELCEELVEKATFKSVVLLMHSDGWFEEDDTEKEDKGIEN